MSEEFRPFGYVDDPLEVQVGGEHYKKGGMQPIELNEGMFLSFSCGSIVKYLYRHEEKGKKQDLEKCLHYVEFLKKYNNWYIGRCENGNVSFGNTDNLFYKFILSNPQLNANKIRAYLAISERDVASLESAILEEMKQYEK